ncbi:hypothetical protein MTO96_030387 [Rhipicephalus appendiculatus]
MSTSTTEVNVTTTTITRATSKAELVDENPDLAAECVQQFCADGKPVEPQSLPQPLLANYEPMLNKLTPETSRKQELLPGPPTERVFDRDESGSVTVDVRKTLDEENVDNDKIYQHKLEGTEARKLEEKQAMKEAFQEANTFDNVLMQKTLAKGQVTKKRTLVETVSAKRFTSRRENEAAKLDQVGCTIKRNVEETGNAEENVEKSEKQLENIEKVTCTSPKHPPCPGREQVHLRHNRPSKSEPADRTRFVFPGSTRGAAKSSAKHASEVFIRSSSCDVVHRAWYTVRIAAYERTRFGTVLPVAGADDVLQQIGRCRGLRYRVGNE